MHFSKQHGVKVAVFGLTSFAALALSSSANADTYTVQSGDTLSDIAEKNDRTVDYLVAINNIADPNHIVSGQKIELGDGQSTVVANQPAAAPAAPETPASPAAPTTYSNTAGTYYSQPAAPAATAPAKSSGVVLSNGNTAGQVGSYAASQMEAATGVPAATWEHIIARESNGQVNAYNPSGASGLFQTMPGWGSTATVQDQVQAAINAYNAQGLSAWGY